MNNNTFIFGRYHNSSNEVFKDCVSDMAVEIRKLGNPTSDTAENNDTVKKIAGS
jgi:hypothetical protein